MTSTEDIAAELARLGSATIGESGGLAADRRLRPAWPGAGVAAPAYPVGCTPGDNLAVHVAVTKAPRGSVLVVIVGQVAALEVHRFPVLSATIALTGATKDKPGSVGVPVRVGGVEVSAGDWVVADVDGVTFVPRTAVDEVVTAGRAREAKEAGFFEALRSGSTTVDLL